MRQHSPCLLSIFYHIDSYLLAIFLSWFDFELISPTFNIFDMDQEPDDEQDRSRHKLPFFCSDEHVHYKLFNIDVGCHLTLCGHSTIIINNFFVGVIINYVIHASIHIYIYTLTPININD